MTGAPVLRMHNPNRGGHWRLPRDEFHEAREQFPWLCFAGLTDDQMDMFEAWAETRPNVVWVDDRKKASTLREMIRDAQSEALGGDVPFEGTFGSPALDRLVEAISGSDAIFYLDARDTPVPH